MAQIVPFRGLLFNSEKVKDMEKVVTPPYDVISEDEQREYYRRHPYNVIRLDKGLRSRKDTKFNNNYTRAAYYLNKWISDGILLRDKKPALYFTSVEFPLKEKTITRYGLISLVGLEPYHKGRILPHEQTFSKVKTDRLNLMKACHANFSHIFSLYSDRKGTLDMLKDSTRNTEPDMDHPDDEGHRHRLWRITNEEMHRFVTEAMNTKRLFIADGHHRYETALNYREWLSRERGSVGPDHPSNFVMMYLCSMQDEGLTILPTHRVISDLETSMQTAFIHRAKDYFDIQEVRYNEKGVEKAKEEFAYLLGLKTENSRSRIGVFLNNRPAFYVLTLKPNVMDRIVGDELAEPLKSLDVAVLTRLIFIELLGLDESELDDDELIEYSSDNEEAIDMVASGNADISFILNPPSNDQVRRIAEEGVTMPRKTTYYYPKALSGQVMNKLAS